MKWPTRTKNQIDAENRLNKCALNKFSCTENEQCNVLFLIRSQITIETFNRMLLMIVISIDPLKRTKKKNKSIEINDGLRARQ